MRAIVESFEIRQNRSLHWLYAILLLLSISAFAISHSTQPLKKSWIGLAGILMSGAGLLLPIYYRTTVSQTGLEVRNLKRKVFIQWTSVESISYELSYLAMERNRALSYVLASICRTCMSSNFRRGLCKDFSRC